MRLSDLLEKAKAGAPPARLDVNDLVAAGRRRQRRRSTGWAIAAVVAVAIAIGVPQIVTRSSAPPPAPPAATSTTTPAKKLFSFTPTFRGYTVDGYQIDAPGGMALGWTSALVRETGVTDHNVGVLTVFPPGVVPSHPSETKKIATDPIGGRGAYFVRERDGRESLIWEYTAGGFADVGPRSLTDPMSRADLRRVASGFKPGGGQPVRTALSASYIPADHRLITVSDFGALFVPEEQIKQILAQPDRNLPPGPAKRIISLSLEPVSEGSLPEVTAKPTCSAEGPVCHVLVDEGRYSLVVSGRGVSLAEVRMIFESVTPADPDDPSTWTVADEAFPTFVRPALD